MVNYNFVVGSLVFFALSACHSPSISKLNQNERSSFCTMRFHQSSLAQATTIDEIKFPSVYRAMHGTVASSCLVVRLVEPTLIKISDINVKDSATKRAKFLVNGKPFLIAEIGNAELIQLEVDARPGRNVVLFEVDGTLEEWVVNVTQPKEMGPETPPVFENIPIQKVEDYFDRDPEAPEEAFEEESEGRETPDSDLDPQQKPDIAPSPEPTPVPVVSRPPPRNLEVIIAGNGDRVLIDLNSTPMTIMEMITTDDDEREMILSTR